MFLGGQKSYYKYRYFKSLETTVNVLKDSIEVSNQRIEDILSKGQKTTTQSRNSSIAIDNKLKEDEKFIDASDFSDDKLDKLLAKYGED